MPFGGGGYEIRLVGRLSDSVLAAFECEAWGLTVSVEPAEMVLYGPVQDQAALCDLVDRFLSHGLEVVEVRRLPTSPDELGATRATAVTPVELHEPAAERQERLGRRARRVEAGKTGRDRPARAAG